MRLQHVAATFPPGRENDLRAFYGGVLGLVEEPLPEAVADAGWIWFLTEDSGVELHFIPDERPPDPTRRHHFCLQVDDIADTRSRLAGAGHEPVPAGREIPGHRRFFVRDPLGNLVELVELVAS
jgi:catechol 2,3-dioxygenase-like lactoylglutathione lyase family enzyme